MSAAPLPVGTEIQGNGKDKIDSKIEDALEAHKPADMLSRRDAVYHVRNQILADAASSMPDTFIAFASTAPRNVLISTGSSRCRRRSSKRNTEIRVSGEVRALS